MVSKIIYEKNIILLIESFGGFWDRTKESDRSTSDSAHSTQAQRSSTVKVTGSLKHRDLQTHPVSLNLTGCYILFLTHFVTL